MKKGSSVSENSPAWTRPPEGKCEDCNERDAVLWFSTGDMLSIIHGNVTKICKRCELARNIKALPELEQGVANCKAQIEKLKAELAIVINVYDLRTNPLVVLELLRPELEKFLGDRNSGCVRLHLEHGGGELADESYKSERD